MTGGDGVDGRGLRAALLLARAMVWLYPPAFRRTFRDAVLDAFEAAARAEGRRGGRAGLRLARRVVRDTVRAVPREWAAAVARGRRRGRSRGEGRGAMGARSGAWAQDVRYAGRSLARSPAFTAVVVGVLGAGIGAAVAVLSLVDAYLLRGMPFPGSERMMAVSTVVPVPWREAGDLFDPPISWDLDVFTLVDGDRPRLVRGQWVAPGFFDAFGIEPALGRAFRPGEAGPDGAALLVISHRLWQERYGGDPGILGRTVRAFSSDRPDDAEVFTIVGVLPEDFWFFNPYTEVLAPLRADNPVYMGRLREGVPPERAAAELTRRGRARMEDPPADLRVGLTPHHERYVAGVRPTLLVLSLGVGLVLLVACGNAAMLLVVRTLSRRREFAVRGALGAPRGRLARQLLFEGVLLAGGAALLGTALGGGLSAAAGAAVEARLGLPAPGGAAAIGVGPRVVLGAVLMAVLTGLVFGLAPLVGALRPGMGAGLAAGGRNTGGGGGGGGAGRSAVLVVEIALSLALLIGAGLALRSALHLSGAELGFDPSGVVTAQINLRQRSYPEPADRVAFYDRLRRALDRLPGLESAGLTLRAPYTWTFNTFPVEGDVGAGEGAEGRAEGVGQIVGPGFFGTMRIPLVQGRLFGEEDVLSSEPVVVVSESLARRLWPDGRALGWRLREVPRTVGGDVPSEPEPWRRVVGVVPDVWNSVELGAAPDYYVPYTQLPTTTMSLVLRPRRGASFSTTAVEGILGELDPTVALAEVRGLEEATREATAPSRFLAAVLTGFSVFVGVLAVLGLYGVVSYAAARRRRDVAVRMALGARGGRVVRLFVLERAPAVALGLLLGVGGGAVLGRVLAGELRGVSATDPFTFAVLPILLGVSALVATWVPARRAARSDPMEVLRDDG